MGNSVGYQTSTNHIRITTHEITDASDRSRGLQMFYAFSVQCSEKMTEAGRRACLSKSRFPCTVSYR